MISTKIGDFTVTAERGELTFRLPDGKKFSLLGDDIAELLEFLTTSSETEFNRRLSFRVPVNQESGLRVSLQAAGESRNVVPKNVGLTGMLIEVPSSLLKGLKIGDMVALVLEFEGREVSMPGTVRRLEGNGVGIHFPGTIRDGEVRPPASITKIVMEIQRRWIGSRVIG